jgi:phage terminase large subunit
MSKAEIKLPQKLVDVFAPQRGAVQYRAAYGGRGSGKSYSFALMAAVWGYAEPLRVLCARDLQVSIKESFHAELKAAIESQPWLAAHYDVGIDYLRGKNGTEFIFRGMRSNISAIKSLAKIDLTIVEEAEDIKDDAWTALEATIFRQPKSELWAIWNPGVSGSPVDERFIKHPPKNAIVAKVNYSDNPFFPPGLETLRLREQERLDRDMYAHVWEGAYKTLFEAAVFKNWRVEEFEIDKAWTLRQGADWGYSIDPSTLIQVAVVGKNLYIAHEAYKVGWEIDMLPDLFLTVPESEKWPITADSARPETIAYMRRHGFPHILPAVKGARSVEEGVAFLQSFDIIVHPRCEHTIRELELYSYKRDELTGKILPILKDKDNHVIDALRYACESARRAGPRKMDAIKYRSNGVI